MPFSSWSVDGLVRNPRQQDWVKRGREPAPVQASDPVKADGNRQGLAYACGSPLGWGNRRVFHLTQPLQTAPTHHQAILQDDRDVPAPPVAVQRVPAPLS